MNPSDSLRLDEHLARLLAAYDPDLGGGDGKAPTIDVPRPPTEPAKARLTAPSDVVSFDHDPVNEGSMGDLLPDTNRTPSFGSGQPIAYPPPSATTHRIGRFELRRQLGKGGCGIVFLAYDPKLQRELALKIPRPEMLLSPDARRRLIREAMAAAEFDHPNLVPVFETGEIGPVCFIATAFCPGQTLAEWLDRQSYPVPLRQAARLIATLAEAVQHAHDRGVLHRDLKPNNVILQQVKTDPNDQDPPAGACPLRGEHYIPRIVDFGLAKLSERGPSDTASRQILGTPKYMAPEQAQGKHEDIGPPADVYALGVVLYEVLAGRAPYDGETDVDVLRQAIEGNLTMPRALRKEIPRDLEAICLKALAKTPAKRYRTAIDLSDDLRRFLDGKPTVARPLKWVGRAGRWLRRNDQAVALVVVSVIALFFLTVGGWKTHQATGLRRDRDTALSNQAARSTSDRHREYARHVRDAFLAWRAGDAPQAAASIALAVTAAEQNSDSPDFALDYLSRLRRAELSSAACPAGPAGAVAVSPDGAWVVTGHADGTLAVWPRGAGAPAGATKAHPSDVRAIAFLTAASFVTAGNEPVSRTWAIGAKGELTAGMPLSALARPAAAMVLSAGGRRAFVGAAGELFAGHDDGTIRLFDAQGRAAKTFSAHTQAVTCLAVSPDGTTLASGAEDACVCVWDVATGAPRARLRGHEGPVRGLRFAPDGRTLYTAGDDGHLKAWDVTADPDGRTVRGLPAAVVAVAAHPDRERYAVAYADGTLDVASRRGGPPTRFPAAGRGPLAALRFPADGPPVGVELAGRVAVVWEFADAPRAALRAAAPDAAAVTAADISLESGQLALGDDRGRVTVVALGTGAAVAAFETHLGQPVRHLTFSPEGDRLATPTDNHSVGVWDIGNPVRRHQVHRPGDGALLIRFLTGDDRLVVAGRGGAIRMWHLGTNREELTMLGHAGRVTSLAVSPDGRTLMSGGGDGEVKLWDLRTGMELAGVKRHAGPVTAAEFAPSGRQLLTGGRGDLALWDAGDPR